ncbi:MAG: transcription elongation factor GreA [Spirochaetota bacterium]|nr:transcription elongation factor GreA [Spirochaetota bacterium]
MSKDLDLQKREIKDEITKLKHEFKIELPKKIAEARAYGDLKENAEYHAARERQSFVQGRIAQLSKQLSNLNSLNVSDISKDKIAYGSKVRIIDQETNNRIEFELVSSNDINPSQGKISLSSPIGAALQGRTVGEEVDVTLPVGKKKYYIEKLITFHNDEFEEKYKQP